MGENKTAKALGWKLLERFGVQGIQFVLQLVLARLLSPEHYGTLSLMIIFVNLANVFVQSGFNTALIRKKDIDERDYSSVFWVSLVISALLYMGVYFSAPLIAEFYEMPDIVMPFRALGLMLFPGAFNSIQLAKVRRELNFKKVFFSNIGGMLAAGIVSIVIALNGGGLWALVAQSILNITVTCIVMMFTVRWRPKLVCDFRRVGVLISFGWKLLVSNLIDVLYQDIRSIVIGKKYDSGTLGYYNRGKHFPQFIITAINGAVQTVMLPVMAKKQDNKDSVKLITRTSIMVSAYTLFPMMAGLAAVATPIISLLLTDKWLPAVPYMMIYCFSLAFTPVHSCNLQAINAMGRSDIFLKLEIIKKTVGIGSLVIAVFCFDSPIAIAMTGIFTTVISCFVNAYPNKKLINYSYFEQMRDILPSFALAMVMFGAVYAMSYISLHYVVVLVLQIFAGATIYLIGSFAFKLKGFVFLKEYAFDILKKKRGKGQKIVQCDESEKKIENFLQSIDSDFPVPLSQKQDFLGNDDFYNTNVRFAKRKEKEMKKLLLLGGSRYIIPVIEAAHKLGCYVITCDYLPNNIAHQYSDEYHNVSIVDKDAVLELAKKLQIDGIMSFACDPGVVTAAYVAEKMGLPHSGSYESVSILQNKGRFRKFLAENGFNVPVAKGYKNIEDALKDVDIFNWPVIVKPTDSAGSKGVTRVEEPSKLKESIEYAISFSLGKEFIIEDFIEKKGYSSDTDSFSVDGELKFVSFSSQRFDENASNPYTPAAYSWPSSISEDNQKILTAEIQRLLKLLNMKTSIYNIETREATNGKPYIMELSPRGGGNRLAECVRYATGVDLITNAVRAAIGEKIVDVEQKPYNGYYGEVILHSDKAGIFDRLWISDEIEENIVETDLWISSGDTVGDFSAANEAIGTLVLRFELEEDLEKIMNDISKFVRIILK